MSLSIGSYAAIAGYRPVGQHFRTCVVLNNHGRVAIGQLTAVSQPVYGRLGVRRSNPIRRMLEEVSGVPVLDQKMPRRRSRRNPRLVVCYGING